MICLSLYVITMALFMLETNAHSNVNFLSFQAYNHYTTAGRDKQEKNQEEMVKQKKKKKKKKKRKK